MRVTLEKTMGGHRIRLWRNATRTVEELTNTWRLASMPKALYVEGVVHSTSPRDVELVLTYDENPEGESNPLFMASDKIRLTVVKLITETVSEIPADRTRKILVHCKFQSFGYRRLSLILASSVVNCQSTLL